MALFRVANERAQFDAASNDARDQYGAGIRFTQEGNARVTTSAGTFYNQGIPMSGTGQVAIVDATAGLPSGTIYHNGLPMSGDKVCVSKNATAVVSNGLPFDSAGALAADINFDLNFIGTDTLNSSVTFTRTSTATYFNSAGVLTSAAINTPRFDYNPATLAAQGLLIEEQRTNFFTNTATASLATIGTGTVTGPDNALCRTLIPTAGAVSFPNITGPVQSFTLSLGQTVDWAMSGWVAAGPVGTITLEPHFSFAVSVGGASFTYAEFQINTSNWTVRSKAYGSGLSEVSAPTITLFRPGLYRFTWVVRYTQGATARNSVSVSLQARNTSGIGTYTADGVSGVQYALLQAETGSFVTSTIPTTTTALTRSVDVASVNTLSPWFNSAAGTIYAELMRPSLIPSGAFANAWSISDNTNNERFISYNTGSAQSMDAAVTDGGVLQATLITTGSITANTTIKTAFAYAVNDFAFVRDAGTVQTDTSGTLPTVDRLYIGANSVGTGQWTGWIRRLTAYPRRLSNAELQSITA